MLICMWCIHIHVYNAYILISLGATQNTHMNTKNTSGLILFPSLAEQDEGLKCKCMLMYNVDPSSRWVQIPTLLSSCPWIPGSLFCSSWTCKLPRLQPHSSCSYWDPLCPSICPSHPLSLPPSLPHLFPPSFSPSFPRSLPHSLPPSFLPSLPLFCPCILIYRNDWKLGKPQFPVFSLLLYALTITDAHIYGSCT